VGKRKYVVSGKFLGRRKFEDKKIYNILRPGEKQGGGRSGSVARQLERGGGLPEQKGKKGSGY